MKAINKPPEHQIYHAYGLYYLTSLIPISLIYAALIIFYRKNNYFPFFEELGLSPLEKRFIEVGFNVCAWIMLPTILFTDGLIQIYNNKNKSKEKANTNNLNFMIYRIITVIASITSFISCIAYGSIIISNSLKYCYICETIFLVSTTIYFLFINVMFKIVSMNENKSDISSHKRINIGILDWMHASIGIFLFSLSYLLKNYFAQDSDITICISKTLQYIGITLLLLNFIRIHLRMPKINFFLSYPKKD